MRFVAALVSLLALFCVPLVSVAAARAVQRYQPYFPAAALPLLTRDHAANATLTPVPTVDRVVYHDGPVMQDYHAYTIFWAPAPHTIDVTYEALINRWFDDVSGTSLLNIATQYFQFSPPQLPFANVASASHLSGTWVDTTNAYPHAGTPADPLVDDDIQAEVQRAITHNGWPAGGNDVEYFVYTASGVESCFSSAKQSCTPGVPGVPASQQYLAYHSFFGGAPPLIYGNMPYAASWVSLTNFTSPNAAPEADLEIVVTSHEQFESMTDPTIDAWFSDSDGEEIADKCASLGVATVTLNGNPYVVQGEWSNSQGECALGLLCSTQPRAGCKTTTQPRASVLQLKASPVSTRDSFTWKWGKGTATSLADFGDPTTSTSYGVCVYDETDSHPILVMDVATSSGSGWSKTSTGFKYKNKAPTGNQPQQMTLRTTAAGKATITVTGKGDLLPIPELPLEQTPKVIVQLQNTAGVCWEADYSLATKNTSAQFKAKSD